MPQETEQTFRHPLEIIVMRFDIKYRFKSNPTMVVYTKVKADSKGEAKRKFIQAYSHVNGGILDVKKVACGCRFESDASNTVLLCDECAKLPCHTGA